MLKVKVENGEKIKITASHLVSTERNEVKIIFRGGEKKIKNWNFQCHSSLNVTNLE